MLFFPCIFVNINTVQKQNSDIQGIDNQFICNTNNLGHLITLVFRIDLWSFMNWIKDEEFSR
jgi:hypothetical protein